MRLKLFLIGTLVALAQPGSAMAQGTLKGTVTDASTGAPVVGAHVTLPDLNMAASTLAGGSYEITDVPAGTHNLAVELLGYQPVRLEVVITEGETTELNVGLSVEALELGGLVAVGSRAKPRTVTESPVPVDVIPAREIVNQGDVDFANLLRNVAPSFNVNTQPISDAATFARPANLRGLAPDHTLVLINGKRRHRTAVITWYGNGLADGSQGPDIALIPGMALEQAEVLRDGASAQYGSDAIAGVMNLVLKNYRSGGSMEIKTGGYLRAEDATSVRFQDGSVPGDGEMYAITGNVGLPLGETGFLNLTGEYGNSNNTDRSTQRNDAIKLINSGNTHVRQPAQIWGSPQVSDDIKVWANMGYLLEGDRQLYSHANFVSKQVEGGFYFRNPNTRSGVFGSVDADGNGTLLIGDMIDARDTKNDGSAGCPEVKVQGGIVADKEAWAKVLADDNCWTFQKYFPGGFTPQFGAYVMDMSAVVGLKGERDRLSWDVSGSWGKSNMDFYMYNTVNASLGPDQPCADDSKDISFVVPDQECTPWFNPGVYDQQEMNLNLDLAYEFDDRLNVAGGAELRNERFQIVPGDEPSWTPGPLASQGFTPGSNGFTGFGPLTEGAWNRVNLAAYGDLEITDRDAGWSLGFAQRAEYFSDFGITANGKFAGRLSISDENALRASVSSGFRAPTPGQQNAFNISTIYDPDIMDLTNNGTVPSTGNLAAAYGGQPLKPEKSVNIAVGMVHERGGFSLSADAFLIDVSDRLTTSRNFTLTQAQADSLVDEDIITDDEVLKRFRFFINDFATRTMGIDLVAAWEIRGDGGTTSVTSAWNYTKTEVTEWNPETLSDNRIRILENGLPGIRGNVVVNHTFAAGTRFLVRGSYWDGYFDGEQPYYELTSDETIDYPPRVLFDMEAAHTFADRWTLTVGGTNVLNTYPEEYPGAAAGVGNTYGQFTPFGFNGGFYYTRLGYSW